MTFINIEQQKPEIGVEVILYNEKWINEDFNPKGIRIGFWDDLSGWTSAYWCNYHDDYHTRISEENDYQFSDPKGTNQIPTHWMSIKSYTDQLDFGDYAIIEQKRYGVENEYYLHKVIGRGRSNAWVDVPVQSPAMEVLHDHMEDVIWCVCCGVDERNILKYKASDVKPNTLYK